MVDKETLYNLIKETFLLLDDGDRRFFRDFDLTTSRYYALVHIGHEPGISFSQLSDHMLCDKSNVTRIIKGLEGNGYVTRRPHETDGRALRLYLTEAGASLRRELMSAHRRYNEQRLQCLNDLEQADLLQGLNHLHECMRLDLYGPAATET